MKQYHGDVHCHTNNFFFRMFRALRNEFRWSNFGFDYPYPEDFATFAVSLSSAELIGICFAFTAI